MGGGRLGEMVFGDPPGSFNAMSDWDKMELEAGLRETKERRLKQEQSEMGKRITEKTVEHEGENDG